VSRYPKINEKGWKATEVAETSWSGLFITVTFLALFVALLIVSDQTSIARSGATISFGLTTALLRAYRFCKEVRSSLSASS
jgi:hypothetical protein